MMSTLESLLGFTVAALLYAEGKVVTGGFFFVNCCFISIPKKVVDQGGKAEQENALFCIHHHNSTHFCSPWS